MELKLTPKQYRRLLDLVYIGNWVLNSTRGEDRIKEYDEVESLVFSYCLSRGMTKLVELYEGELIPSRAFADGGIRAVRAGFSRCGQNECKDGQRGKGNARARMRESRDILRKANEYNRACLFCGRGHRVEGVSDHITYRSDGGKSWEC